MRKLLYKISANLPCRLIDINGQQYLERYFIGTILGITFYLHRFVSADTEREVHDHPWKWAFALVLAGGYEEERLRYFDAETGWVSKVGFMGFGTINIIGPSVFHRIGHARRETYTLFVHGPRIKNWGFLSNIKGNAVTGTKQMTFYHQPYDTRKTIGWEKTAPKGRCAGRATFKNRSTRTE